jgi:Flp pilus assembly protein TadG
MSCRGRNRRKGGSLIEFALVLPIFLIVTLAIVELATVLFVRHSMLNAARDAVRSLAIGELDSAGAIDLASQRLATTSIGFSVTTTPDSDSGLDRWVQISAPMSDAALGDPLAILGGGDLTVRVTMRKED